jgi:hypothetical protein
MNLLSAKLQILAIAAGFTALVFGLQYSTGAYSATLNAYPDEAAHYVTGVMVDQMVRTGGFWKPLQFIESYYLHYPKVAIGHWPPFLYVVQAAWTLVFDTSRSSVLFLQAVLGGLLGVVIFRSAQSFLGWAAAGVAIAYLILPGVVPIQSMVMADSLLTMTMLLATLYFGKAVETRSFADTALAGLFATLAIMTKGTGWALFLIPGFAALLFRRFAFLFAKPTILTLALVLLICLPWQLYTAKMVVNGFEESRPSLAYALAFLPASFDIFSHELGKGTLLLAAIGLYASLFRHRTPFWEVVLCSILAQLSLHLLTPAGMEFRKLLPFVPPLLLLAGAGALFCFERLPPKWRFAQSGAAVALLLLCSAPSLPYPAKPTSIYPQLVAELDKLVGDNAAILISSGQTWDGEGAMVSEYTLLHPQPRAYVLRASKLLSSQLWSGQGYRTRFQRKEELEQIIKTIPISFIVFDHRPPPAPAPHHGALAEFLREHAHQWSELRRYGPADNPTVSIYKWEDPNFNAPARVKVNLSDMIGRSVSNF